MSYLLFSLLLMAMVCVFVFAWHGLGRTAFPLTLLVILAVTGQMSYARLLLDELLIRLGWQADVHGVGITMWSWLWYHVPGPLAIALAVWLGLEIGCRFPGGESRSSPSCRKCGYDLTGNTSGTCPECGSPCEGVRGPADERG